MEFILILLILGCCATSYKIVIEAKKKSQEEKS